MRRPGVLLAMLAAAGGALPGCGDGRPRPELPPWPTVLPPNPEDGYHFDGAADPFYEGWYHRLAVPDRAEAFFFIYGVINPAPGSAYSSEAFLYCGRASTVESVYQKVPPDEFSALQQARDVRIGNLSRATAPRFAGLADDGVHRCEWDIAVSDGIAWPQTMGWMTGSAGLETSWHVGTLRGRHTGWVRFDGDEIGFEQAPGYADHNWGSTFPAQWIWLQANTFDEGDAALAASGGTVQFQGGQIEAAMIGLWHDGALSTFRTQDLDTVSQSHADSTWTMEGQRGLERIRITASCDPAGLFHLLVPTAEGMKPRAWESLGGELEVTLERRESEQAAWGAVFAGRSAWAGVERGE
jgi:tocopherol cyclase